MDEKIISKLEDKKFVEELLIQKNDDDVKKLFNSQGIEISDNEIDELGEVISEITKSMKSMSENELEGIAGGGKIIFSDYFRKWGETQGIDKGGTPSVRGPIWKLGFGGKARVPAVKGTPLGNFLYNNANELALVSIAGATAALTLGAVFVINKGQQWFDKRKS